MELKQFTYVRQVAESGSFTKAAAELFISQPALSNYVSKVEEDLGVKLFDRSANPLKLTYAGEQYVKRAKAILGQMEEMNRELRDITHHMTGRLRIGFPSERIVYMLPLLLKPLKDRYPGIDVEVSTGPGNQLIADLKAGNVDFVFLPYWTPLKDIVQVEVSQEELVLVAAKEYLNESCFLDRGKKIINWKEAAKLPLITLKKGRLFASPLRFILPRWLAAMNSTIATVRRRFQFARPDGESRRAALCTRPAPGPHALNGCGWR